MSSDKNQLFDLAVQCNALLFGEFTLKSGRVSPYFFNAGKFSNGQAINQLASLYARMIHKHFADLEFSIFGPAYKGIPLSAAIASSLYDQFAINASFVYNRKEQKSHGEGGIVVGDFQKRNVLIVDDVITAGTAIDESVAILKNFDVNIVGVAVALDRQEKAPDSDFSAIQLIEKRYGFNVHAVATLDDLISYAKENDDSQTFENKLQAYREKWGIETR